jgi:hypothetical protein
MLSHVLGRVTRVDLEEVFELRTRVVELEAARTRRAQQHQDTLRRHDARIQELEMALAVASRGARRPPAAAPPVVVDDRFDDRSRIRLDKWTRALVSARERAKSAEARYEALVVETEHLRTAVRRLNLRHRAQENAGPHGCPGATACRIELSDKEQLRILYLGGRTGSVEQLRHVAAQMSTVLDHHDGGQETSVHRIGQMIERCHAVVCPIDCVSHNACLVAKSHCKRLDKAFMPVRSSGTASFRRALEQLLASRQSPGCHHHEGGPSP